MQVNGSLMGSVIDMSEVSITHLTSVLGQEEKASTLAGSVLTESSMNITNDALVRKGPVAK